MIKLCSYNIHGAKGGLDRKYNPARIIRVIQGIKADIFGLQEVRLHPDKINVLDLIKRETTHNTLFLKTLTDQQGPYGNALISRFPILRHFDVDLEINAEQTAEMPKYEARRAIFAELRIEQQKHLWVIVTHLAIQKAARHLQFEKMIRLIKELIMIKNEPCVLLGDMNEWSRPVHFLEKLDRLFSKHVSRRTFPAIFPLLPLDRIWISRHLQVEQVWTYRGKYARTASDHLPICARISSQPPSAHLNHQDLTAWLTTGKNRHEFGCGF